MNSEGPQGLTYIYAFFLCKPYNTFHTNQQVVRWGGGKNVFFQILSSYLQQKRKKTYSIFVCLYHLCAGAL